METTVFNPIQLYLLQLFSKMNSEQELKDLQELLSDFYFKKVEKRALEIYEEKGWTPKTLEEMSNEHFRTPYK